MKLTLARKDLLKPLQMISGVVERRQTLPILSNVLMKVSGQQLSLTGTDLEIELIGYASVLSVTAEGMTTVSARKLLDICRALPEEAELTLTVEGGQMIIQSGKSRFTLAVIPAEDYPRIENAVFATQFDLLQSKLKKLLSKIHFAMGQQDVRHYLNGALFDIDQGVIKCVATDGHRLAYSTIDQINSVDKPIRVILPRKSVLELMRLLEDSADETVQVSVSDNHFRAKTPHFVFTTKLINAQYPDYKKLIPRTINTVAVACRESFKQALARASILSNEKFRGIRLYFDKDLLKMVANNPEQEQAEESVPLEYEGNGLEVGFNAAYLLDVLSTIAAPQVRCSFTDASAGVLIEASDKEDASLYVVMPMRL